MTISDQGHVTLMLTARLGRDGGTDTRPLSVGEWVLFSAWLKQHGIESSALLKKDPEKLLCGWNNHRIPLSRILALLNRGAAAGFHLDRWEKAGLWTVFKGEADYPTILEKRLCDKSPPVLFGCGNRRIPQSRRISVVGSRNACDEDLKFARYLGVTAADSDYTVISGGAHGIDEAAMLSALNHEGTAVGVLADSLYRAALSRKYRDYLRSGNLTLLSTVNPETSFTTGAAMGRNKYIYCLSDAAIVVCSKQNNGGTWHGATENLNKDWGVPLWVKHTNSPESGNRSMIAMGARELPEKLDDLSSLASAAVSKEVTAVDPVLVGEPSRAEVPPSAKQMPERATAECQLAATDFPMTERTAVGDSGVER